jgi:hypothetical protein
MATPVPTRRSEKRTPKVLAAELSRPDEREAKEMTFTENVSPRGARITTMHRWLPGTRVLVIFLRDGVRSEGKVTYFQRKGSRVFAIGVELSGTGAGRMGNVT